MTSTNTNASSGAEGPAAEHQAAAEATGTDAEAPSKTLIAQDHTVMDETGRRMMSAAATVRNQVSTTETDISALLAVWDDPQAREIGEEWATARRMTEETIDRLHQLGEVVRSSAAAMADVDSEAAAMFSKRPPLPSFRHPILRKAVADAATATDAATTDEEPKP
ncbi:WXG100 family type VII secretion target [Nocardia wallacei]|uniref:WXG100 family type VII secretion target n=1 Tax=Nocardia wallacei TaxID=480035 RepID=UPI002454CBA4|nr:WXG100 family type VII secretion target [Nocardia wallacei]